MKLYVHNADYNTTSQALFDDAALQMPFFLSSRCSFPKKKNSQMKCGQDLLTQLYDIAIQISLFALPARSEQLAHVESREGMRLRVDNHLVQREEVVGREQQVEIFQSLRLWGGKELANMFWEEKRYVFAKKQGPPTSQKLSMLSFVTGGITLAFDRLVNPPPSSTAV